MDNAHNAKTVHNLENDEFLTPLLGGPVGFAEQAGVIRPGIMVLKKVAAENERSRQIYKKLNDEGKTFEEIDKALGLGPDGKSQLTPKNVDYFTVRPHDCVNPDNARKILEYADEDGKLRSLPVWFPVNEWWELIPHSLKCYGQTSGLRHRSNFVPVRDDSERITDMKMVCESPQQCSPGTRLFGGRSWTQRDCDPETCELYQREECKLRGSIECMIPGISGIGTWSIPTSSFYSLNGIKNTLRRVYMVTHGRIANIKDDNNETIFCLRKRLTTIPTIDIATGLPKLRDQYLIVLDVMVDLWGLSDKYDREGILTRGQHAIAMLDNPKIVPINSREERMHSSSEEIKTRTETLQETIADQGITGKQTSEDRPEQPIKEENPQKDRAVADTQMDGIRKLCAKYGIPDQLVEEELKKIKTYQAAAGLIKELNKGDISRFLPK